MHHELVLIDQPQLRQRQWEFHSSHEQSLARLPFELQNGLAQISAQEFRVPVELLQGARNDVLLGRVDCLGEGFHPVESHFLQLPDASATRWCARVAPQDVHYDGRRKYPGLRDLVESDGGIVSGGEFERSCGMSGRSEDVI
jgi:hypothetical protein